MLWWPVPERITGRASIWEPCRRSAVWWVPDRSSSGRCRRVDRSQCAFRADRPRQGHVRDATTGLGFGSDAPVTAMTPEVVGDCSPDRATDGGCLWSAQDAHHAWFVFGLGACAAVGRGGGLVSRQSRRPAAAKERCTSIAPERWAGATRERLRRQSQLGGREGSTGKSNLSMVLTTWGEVLSKPSQHGRGERGFGRGRWRIWVGVSRGAGWASAGGRWPPGHWANKRTC